MLGYFYFFLVVVLLEKGVHVGIKYSLAKVELYTCLIHTKLFVYKSNISNIYIFTRVVSEFRRVDLK